MAEINHCGTATLLVPYPAKARLPYGKYTIFGGETAMNSATASSVELVPTTKARHTGSAKPQIRRSEPQVSSALVSSLSSGIFPQLFISRTALRIATHHLRCG